MPFLQVPHSFFQKERSQIYGDWKTALFRELLQNSIDAGASQIEVTFESLDNEVRIKFADDGCGMDRKLMEDVYFRLGASTKAENGTQVGGFGRARILTNFAMDRYEIRTQNLLVNGSGAHYEIQDNHPFLKGCVQYLWTTEASTINLKQAAYNFLIRCQTPYVRILFEGNRILQNSSLPGVAETFVEDLVIDGKRFGTLYKREGPKTTSGLHIYVNGIYMGSRQENQSKECLIARISPEHSRQALTAGRDQIHPNFNRVFGLIEQKMATERQYEAEPTRSLDTVFRGRGSYHHTMGSFIPAGSKPYRPQTAAELRDLIKAVTGLDRPPSWNWVSNTEFKAGEFLPDIPVALYSPTDVEVRAFAMFNPENWKFTIREGNIVWGQQTKRAVNLLFCWKIALEFAVRILCDEKKMNLNWMPGFSSGRPAHAEKRDIFIDGFRVAAFMLNPISDGSEKFHMDNRMDRKFLMAAAKHEVSHVVSELHNEDFAYTQTIIDSRYDETEAHSLMVNFRL